MSLAWLLLPHPAVHGCSGAVGARVTAGEPCHGEALLQQQQQQPVLVPVLLERRSFGLLSAPALARHFPWWLGCGQQHCGHSISPSLIPTTVLPGALGNTW